MSTNEQSIPLRSEIAKSDTWDLSSLFSSDEEWNTALAELEKMSERIPAFQGTLGKSAEHLADYLDFSRNMWILGEKLGSYAFLRQSEDEGAAAAR
ncbi:MAG: oligoendopeptidase F, partial [Treponema sp.]|nr:oligoendopeptidase F [Treponema sp.]